MSEAQPIYITFIDIEDLGPEIKSKKEFEEAKRSLADRGFQQIFVHEPLTRVKFNEEARFVAVPIEGVTFESIAEKYRKEAISQTNIPWQIEILVEQFSGEGQHANIFARSGYSSEALKELADTLEEIQSKKNEGRGVTFIQYMIDSLRRDADSLEKVQAVKADCFNQSDKFGTIPDIRDVLEEALFIPGEKLPWIKKK